MKDEFLATLSHELRTPLTAILAGRTCCHGQLEWAASAASTDHRAERARAASSLRLLDVSRIITASSASTWRPVDRILHRGGHRGASAPGPSRGRARAQGRGHWRSRPSRATPVPPSRSCGTPRNALNTTTAGATSRSVSTGELTREIVVTTTAPASRPSSSRTSSTASGSRHGHERQYGGSVWAWHRPHLSSARRHGARRERGMGKGSTFTVDLPLSGLQAERRGARAAHGRGRGAPVVRRPRRLDGLKVWSWTTTRPLAMLKVVCRPAARRARGGPAAEALAAFGEDPPDLLTATSHARLGLIISSANTRAGAQRGGQRPPSRSTA